jgi:hypothetical protein
VPRRSARPARIALVAAALLCSQSSLAAPPEKATAPITLVSSGVGRLLLGRWNARYIEPKDGGTGTSVFGLVRGGTVLIEDFSAGSVSAFTVYESRNAAECDAWTFYPGSEGSPTHWTGRYAGSMVLAGAENPGLTRTYEIRSADEFFVRQDNRASHVIIEYTRAKEVPSTQPR